MTKSPSFLLTGLLLAFPREPTFGDVNTTTRWFVDAGASGDNTGTSWPDAFRDLQDALDAADTLDEIYIARGTYRPDRGTGSREATFRLKDQVTIRGGYRPSGIEDVDLYDPVANPTILSGDLLGNDDYPFLNRKDNAYHVVTSEYVTATLVGLIIRGGAADGLGADESGGGIVINGREVSLLDCEFDSNTARLGGAINVGCCHVNLVRVALKHNRATQWGGAMYNPYGLVNAESCYFIENSAVYGGAIALVDAAGAYFTNTRFAGNKTTAGGGAVASFRFNRVEFNNCDFETNTADNGGAIYTQQYHNSIVVSNCRFAANVALGSGGAVAHFRTTVDHLFVRDSLFVNNSCGLDGGAIWSATRVDNCTIAFNHAGRNGGGMYSGTPLNTVLWGNTDSFGQGESAQIYFGDPTAYAVVTHCAIAGWTGKLGGMNNTGADPLFVDLLGADGLAATGDEDFRLSACSPLIDTGDPKSDASGIDLAGAPRLACQRIDIGAYEGGLGDVNCDGRIDLLDIHAFGPKSDDGCLLGPVETPKNAGCLFSDLFPDGKIDLRDFAVYQRLFGYECK